MSRASQQEAAIIAAMVAGGNRFRSNSVERWFRADALDSPPSATSPPPAAAQPRRIVAAIIAGGNEARNRARPIRQPSPLGAARAPMNEADMQASEAYWAEPLRSE